MDDLYYDNERRDRLTEQPWFDCAKCGKEVRESDWASLCQECGEAEDTEERQRMNAATESCSACVPVRAGIAQRCPLHGTKALARGL